MDYILQLWRHLQAIGADLMLWKQSTQMCSREAHEFMNALMFGWLVLLIFGIWLYRKINHPKKRVDAKTEDNQIPMVPSTNSL